MFKSSLMRTCSGLFMCAFALLGCGQTTTGSDGSKVTIQPTGKIQATDAKGNTATVTGNGQEMTVESKDGKAQLEAKNGTLKEHDDKGNSVEMGTGVSEAELGVPFYPGSTETKDSMKANTDKGQEFISIRLTNDAPAKVVDFYTSKLGKPKSSMTSDSMTMATWQSGKRTEVLMFGKDGTSNKISLTVTVEK